MALTITAYLTVVSSKVMVCTSGRMLQSILANGIKMKCQAVVNSIGLTAAPSLASSKTV